MPADTVSGDATSASGGIPAEAIGYSDHAADIGALADRDALLAYTERLAASYGFDHFLLAMIPPPDAVALGDFVMMSNLPSDVAKGYDKAGMLQTSPGFRKLQATTSPFRLIIMDLDGACPDAAQADYLALIQQTGLREAYYFPVHDASGGRAVFVMLSAKVDLPIGAMTDLYMRCLHIYNRLVSLDEVREPINVDLSERETQCLTWTAAGKTSSEIADILGLSEHTVNHYLNHVARKLNAVNRIQAVVKAIRLGLIS